MLRSSQIDVNVSRIPTECGAKQQTRRPIITLNAKIAHSFYLSFVPEWFHTLLGDKFDQKMLQIGALCGRSSQPNTLGDIFEKGRCKNIN